MSLNQPQPALDSPLLGNGSVWPESKREQLLSQNSTESPRSPSETVCLECMVAYSSRSKLNRHLREQHQHKGRRCFACLDCHKSYNRKEHLLRHKRTVHQGIMEICHECGQTLTSKDKLRNHLVGLHGFQRCLVCREVTHPGTTQSHECRRASVSIKARKEQKEADTVPKAQGNGIFSIPEKPKPRKEKEPESLENEQTESEEYSGLQKRSSPNEGKEEKSPVLMLMCPVQGCHGVFKEEKALKDHFKKLQGKQGH
jgi:Zinc finger, C2H2 type